MKSMPANSSTTVAPSATVTSDSPDHVVLVAGVAHGEVPAQANAIAAAAAHGAICEIAGEIEYIDYRLGTVHELSCVGGRTTLDGNQ